MSSTTTINQPELLKAAILRLAEKVTRADLRQRLIAAANRTPTTSDTRPPAVGEPIAAELRATILAFPESNLTRQRGMAEGWLTSTAPPEERPERPTACQPLRTLTAPQAAILALLTSQPLTLAEICRQRPMPESTARRALAGLVAGGYSEAHGLGTNTAPFMWRRKA